MRFLAYDVETANNKDMGSICAVGWVLFQRGAILQRGYSLINPKSSFNPYNVGVHGITAASVADAPTFAQYWDSTLRELMTSSVIIAHHASYDISATEQALHNAHIDDPGIDYADFVPVCRHFLPDCSHHSLDCMADLAGVRFDHHNAGEDARAIVEIAQYLCDRFALDGLEDLLLLSRTPLQNTLSNHFAPKPAPASAPRRRQVPSYSTAHCDCPVDAVDDALLGCSFCLTGDFPGYDRDQLERMILQHGGIVKNNMSCRVLFLAVGDYPDRAPGYMSGKHKKAIELIGQGHPAVILTADELLSILRDPASDPRIVKIRNCDLE